MTEKERMDKGLIYLPDDESILNDQLTYLDKLYEYNHTLPSNIKRRNELIKEMFGHIGENCYLWPNNVISNSIISPNVVLKGAYVQNSRISENCIVGPFEKIIDKSI